MLHSFDASVDITDGFQPSSGLIIDAVGALLDAAGAGLCNGATREGFPAGRLCDPSALPDFRCFRPNS